MLLPERLCSRPSTQEPDSLGQNPGFGSWWCVTETSLCLSFPIRPLGIPVVWIGWLWELKELL